MRSGINQMIEKIPLTRAKESYRFDGVGLSRAELACIQKINEIVDFLNSIK